MHINRIFNKYKTSFSFEFFPPKTEEGFEKLFHRMKEDLIPLQPSSVSVTYGAGGSTREYTHNLVMKLHKETSLTVIPHLTCIQAHKDEIYSLVKSYSDNGIENIMVIRGDLPKGVEKFVPPEDGFAYAKDLVEFIKKHFPHMGIGAAGFVEGHPETPNRLKEIEYLKQKVDAGVDYLVTQMFFDNHDFWDFEERCDFAGINVPIIAGIMPITSRKVLHKIGELSPGTRFPAKLLKAIERVQNDDMVQNVGIHWATNQVLELLDNGVSGVHFYTLNKSAATRAIYESLGIENSKQLAAV
jgi:methylenetetrahydrofolate reductase (NADPH)